MAGAPLARSGSLGRLPVDPAAVSWDYLGVGFRFARPSRGLRYSGDIRTAVAEECSLAQGMQESAFEDQALHTRWEVEAVARGPPRAVVVVDLCLREAEGSKSLWAKGAHSCHRGPAETVGRR